MTLKISDNGVDREMTADEETAYLACLNDIKTEAKKQADEAAVKAEARQAVLDKLGLTADEAAALFG